MNDSCVSTLKASSFKPKELILFMSSATKTRKHISTIYKRLDERNLLTAESFNNGRSIFRKCSFWYCSLTLSRTSYQIKGKQEQCFKGDKATQGELGTPGRLGNAFKTLNRIDKSEETLNDRCAHKHRRREIGHHMLIQSKKIIIPL